MKWFKNYLLSGFNRLQYGTLIITVLIVAGCSGSSAITENEYLQSDKSRFLAQQTPDDYIYSVFLVGDAGGASLEPRSEILVNLERMLVETGEQGAIVIVGDNLYPDGLPPADFDGRDELEEKLVAQLETVKKFPGKIVFMPGNHDWASSGEEGLDYINRQERFIEEYLDRGNTFLPDNGNPGPVEVTLTKIEHENGEFTALTLIVLDTHWWLHPHKKPFPGNAGSEEAVKAAAKSELDKLISQNQGNEVIIGSHHPMETYGRHGGKFPAKTHLLPPVGGSLYVAYRKIWGYPQDVPHKTYSQLKDDIISATDNHPGIILAAGHEHSLQFIPFEEDGNPYYQIVSGSATKSSFVREESGPIHTFEEYGFGVLRYFSDRSKRLEFYNESGDKLFETVLPPQKSG
ncbi:MAG TPA: hypothetical protein VKM37_06580 [Balneolaceae bacterium]|nr:hypothetical protein [Balneolaceae bacterium]